MRSVVAALLALGLSAPGAVAQAEVPPTGIRDSFVAVRVADVEASATWYATVFDLVEVHRIDEPTYSIRILRGEGLNVELIEQQGVARAPARHLGLFKAGFFVRDIDTFFSAMQQRGVDTDAATSVDDALSVRSFVMRDLEGNRLQVFERCAERC
jgi:catechol 2,3-dioxygenase-like lactoylglutathione lyase family enzyme